MADAALAERAGTGSAPTLTGKVTNIEFNTQDNQKLNLPDVTFPVAIPGSMVLKCATPTISVVGNELMFNCVTEGVEYMSEVTFADATTYSGNRIRLTGVYRVSVYATKAGYVNSEVATAEFSMGGGMKGDVNNDSRVDIADVTAVINIINGK